MAIVKSFLYIFYGILCVFLILLVLIQKGSEEDLGGAFGGGGGAAESFLGARGDTTLKKVTVIFAILFFILSILIGALELNTQSASATEKTNQKKGTSTQKNKKDKGSSLPLKFHPRYNQNKKSCA